MSAALLPRGPLRAVLRVGASAGLLLAAACEVIGGPPPPPPPPPPEPDFVVSRPFPDIQLLMDVDVLRTTDTQIDLAYAVGTDGAVLRFDGVAWAQEDSGVAVDLESVSGLLDDADEALVMAVGAEGTVLRRVDDVWEVLPSPTTDHLFGVWVRSEDDAFVVGDNGTVLRFDGTTLVQLVDEVLQDTGTVDENGAPIIFAISDPLKGVSGQGPNDVWTVGPRGLIYHYDGTRFTIDPSDTNRSLVDVFTDAGLWAVTTDGVLLHKGADGWRDDEFITPSPVFLQGMWARSDNDIYAVGLAADLFHYNDGEWTLTLVEEAASLRSVDGANLARPADLDDDDPFEPGREIMAVGAGGRIVRGPLVLPREGETLLATRPFESNEDL